MTTVKSYNRDGSIEATPVKVGDRVGFKCDIEQAGTIIAIDGDWLTLENVNGFEGGYIGGDTETREHASDCWARG